MSQDPSQAEAPSQPNPPKRRAKKKRAPWGSCLFFLFVGFVAFFSGGALMYQYLDIKPISHVDSALSSPVSTPRVVTKDQSTVPSSVNSSDTFTAPGEPIQVSPTKAYGEKITAIRTLSKEFDFESEIDIQPGDITSRERSDSDSYKAYYQLSIKEPQPALSLDQVSHASPELAKQLPSLPLLLETASVHPYWHTLMRNKKQRTADNAHHLLKLLTKHNYYDCQTILNLRHPESKRRAVLVQADMDVVADGSDGDRLPTMPDEIVNSTHYQPTTSYSWEKQTTTPNPMVAGYRARMQKADQELADPATSSDRSKWLKDRKKMLQNGIDEMSKRSYLVAEYDPFIVLPVPVIVAKDTYSPNVGDYAIVFYGNKIYPAIVGDAGPDYKMGEASLRMAREINPKSSPYFRPVSDVSVSYLVFPGSRKQPNSAPDYAEIHGECLRLVEELGGLAQASDLHQWTDLLPKPNTERQDESTPEEANLSDIPPPPEPAAE